MASSVATPLEKQFSTIAGLDSMTSTQHPGQHQHHAAVRPRRATSTPPRRTCRRRSPQTQSATAAGDAEPAVVSQRSIPPISRSSTSASARSTLPISTGRRVRRDLPRPAHLDGQRRRAGAGVRLAEVRRAHPARSQGAGHARHRHRRGRRPRSRTRTSTCRPARSTARIRRSPSQANGPADQRRRVPAADRRLSQRRAGAARRRRPRARQRARTTRPRAGSNGERAVVLAIQRQPGTNTVEVVDNVDAPAAGLPRRAAGLGCTSTCSYDRSETIRASVNDVQFTLLLTLVPGRDGDLPVPAQPVGDDHPEPGAADVDHRHLRGHVAARLQPRQSVADGAHARRSASWSTTPS